MRLDAAYGLRAALVVPVGIDGKASGLTDLSPGPLVPTLYERAATGPRAHVGVRVGAPFERPEVFGPCYWPGHPVLLLCYSVACDPARRNAGICAYLVRGGA